MNWCFEELDGKKVVVPADPAIRLRRINSYQFHVLCEMDDGQDLVVYLGQLATLQAVSDELVPDWLA